jgi:hypothetical protein
MSVKVITKKVNECRCELDDCIGKGKPWLSKDERIPTRCNWCHRYTWNGVDKRRKDDDSQPKKRGR